jgi:hypothetical protein
MRLLQLNGDSGFQLVNRIGKDIPPYAILSHTWGSDDDEVTSLVIENRVVLLVLTTVR